ncbi:hypothetical protein SARC_12300 [Sphaeroforma arctica JP610]|uniref:Uncharacterized protein n=1 Tax=Sphaeroforma arctica JP610 TaxID=667725 RepID=A0A0L0FEH8_9EUKA|nr:hypothetical protein SARC_12300 [Sphaeroforma arctica JP610]KNC75167.1 hypothetical protein SARC_12300 [Sphaeroforma arctica JP610]|eukprot:XP_014149069.1 hypothetical protein SARC_12300 [Sphaeroforma arctica JP610]
MGSLTPLSDVYSAVCLYQNSSECVQAAGKGHAVDRCIPHLLEKHHKDIDTLRGLCNHLIGDETYDDVWLLRYLLSNQKVKDCVSPIERSIKWRNSNVDRILLAKDPRAEHPIYPKIKEYAAHPLHAL